VQIITHDDNGQEHRLSVDSVEEYSLSSGAKLFYLSLRAAPSACHWLVGRSMELTSPEGVAALNAAI
jgi:hypothetical protein